MPPYSSILRGINGGGKKTIKTDALKKCYETSGLRNVQTFIQSGNVIFSSKEKSCAVLKEKITRQIFTNVGFNVPILVLARDQFSKIVDENPLLKLATIDTRHCYLTFLAYESEIFDSKLIGDKKQEDELVYTTKKAIYLKCPSEYGKTNLSNSYLESVIKVSATTRN